MKSLIKLIFFLTLFFIISSLCNCTYNKYIPNPCFTGEVLPIFISNCGMTGCHNSNERAAGLNLTSYSSIMEGIKPGYPQFSEIYKVIKGSHPSMPPQNPLNKEQVQTIRAWIESGAKNTNNCSNNCDTNSVSRLKNITPILNKWCVGCHNSSNALGGVNLSTYSSIVLSIPNNKFMGSINHESGISPMPKNGNKLSDCEIKTIQIWINAGYPDN